MVNKMEENKLLQLWNYPFYKLKLDTVDVVKAVQLQKYPDNYQIIGTFKFKAPQYVLNQYQKYNKEQVIEFLHGFYQDNNYVKKFKKTVTTECQNQLINFFYIFNLSPDSVVDYNIDKKEMTMKFTGVMLYKK